MCVYSMVHDHYNGKFDDWVRQVQGTQPITHPNPVPMPGAVQWPAPGQLTAKDIEDFRKLVAEFRELLDAAKRIDIATNQPDCADPEKVKLQEKIERLERVIDALTK